MDSTVDLCIKCSVQIHGVLSGHTHYPFCDSCFNSINRVERKRLIKEWRNRPRITCPQFDIEAPESKRCKLDNNICPFKGNAYECGEDYKE